MGLNMNLKKTKYMVITKQQNIEVKLAIDNTTIERVQYYKYWGTIIYQTTEQQQKIKAKIEIAKKSFIEIQKFLFSKDTQNSVLSTLRWYVF